MANLNSLSYSLSGCSFFPPLINTKHRSREKEKQKHRIRVSSSSAASSSSSARAPPEDKQASMASSTVTFSTSSRLFAPLRDLSSSKSSSSCASSSRLPSLICRPRISCSAAAPEEPKQPPQNLAAALALAAVLGSSAIATPLEALADVAGLTPCKESPAFAKRLDKSLKKLEKRLAKYAPDSAPALALNATIEKTKKRFDFYGSQGLLCGTDGLPHLIVDGDQAHLKEFVYPGILFLYIAGWIGWVGRAYLIEIKATAKKPAEKEIIIDVPLANRLLWRGFTWPLAAISEFRNGKLLEDASNITVSPR